MSKQMWPKGFVYLSEVDSSILQDVRYAKLDNFLGRPALGYNKPVVICTAEAAKHLSAANKEFAKKGYTIKVFDGYRPHTAVQDFWNWAQEPADMLMQATYYPGYKDKTQIFADGFIAKYSKHSRGSTFDLTLVDSATHIDVDMGSSFDLFSPVSHTNSGDIPDYAKSNRQLLVAIMEKHGFQNYSKEWWHFELKDEPYKATPDHHFSFPVE